MLIEIIREKFNHNSIIGILYINNTRVCYTLENKKYLIKTGIYNLIVRYSPKFQKLCLALENNPTILIHPANKPEELQGCIAVGMIADEKKWSWIGNSRQADKVIWEKVMPAIINREKIELKIASI